MSALDDNVKKLQELIDTHKRIVFFGGAGVSTASGIPDFRSADGLYNNMGVDFAKYSPEYLLSHTCLVKEPKVFFEFCRQKLNVEEIMPNVTHYKLAELERKGKLRGIVTQNIDGLHQKAGSEKVYEIHGTIKSMHCSNCGRAYPGDYLVTCGEPIPHCSVCGGVVRQDVTLYEESLPEEAVEGAVRAIWDADMLIIAGTSLVVYPAASFVDYFRGDKLVLMNMQPTPRDSEADLIIREPMAEVFEKIRV